MRARTEGDIFELCQASNMNTGQVWYLNGPNLCGCRMVWFWNDGLKYGQKLSVLRSKMSGIRMVHLIM